MLKQKIKMVFTFVGCWEQINAVMKNLNGDFVRHDCEGFKFAAASTMVEQPNDVGRMHCNMHNYYKSVTYMNAKIHRVPIVMKPMIKVLKDSDMDSASFCTYSKAMYFLPDCLSKCCSPETVVGGFQMSGWSLLSKLPSAVARKVLEELPDLEVLARKGRLFYSEIKEPLEDIIDFNDCSRKSDTCAINHSRCLWTNHPKVMAAQLANMSEVKLERVWKEDAKKLRLLKKEFTAERREQNAVIAGGNLLQDSVSKLSQGAPMDAALPPLPPPPPGIKCSNPVFSTRGTKADRKSWTGCRKIKCRNLFCLSPECNIMSAHHQGKCDKYLSSMMSFPGVSYRYRWHRMLLVARCRGMLLFTFSTHLHMILFFCTHRVVDSCIAYDHLY